MLAAWGLVVLWGAEEPNLADVRLLATAYLAISLALLQAALAGHRAGLSPWCLWGDAGVLLLGAWLTLPAHSRGLSLLVAPVIAVSLAQGRRHAVVLCGLEIAALGLIVAFPQQGRPMPSSWDSWVVTVSALALAPVAGWIRRTPRTTRERVELLALLREGMDARKGLVDHFEALSKALCDRYGARLAAMSWRGPEPRVLVHEANGTRTLHEEAAALWRARRQVLPEGFGAVMTDAPDRQWAAVPLAPGVAARKELSAEAQQILGGLGSYSMVLPVLSYGRPTGLFCLAREGSPFQPSDLAWLQSLLAESVPWLERADLLEQMQRETAARERERIGRDLHDSAVQPYIGLKYGLEALARRATPDNPLSPQISQLLHMTSQELQTLREVVSGLRKGEPTLGEEGFLTALRRQIERFSALYGLKMHVFAPDAALLRGSAAKAVLMMVNEGLTNVRRHSSALAVNVMIDVQPDLAVIRMRNDHGALQAQVPAPFVPRSLAERASEVGGHVAIRNEDNFTEIEITMPLVGVAR